jgi:hypothetical protein
MFATLAGPLPRPPSTVAGDRVGDAEAGLRAVLALQVEAGLVPLTDGGSLDGADPLEAWHRASEATDHPVKAIIRGPYSTGGGAARATRSAAAEAARVIRALTDAGCPLIQVDEAKTDGIADRPNERRRFVDAHRILLEASDSHLSLALFGPAEAIGAETLFELAYPSYLFDLVGQPDDWRTVARAPTERGIICGVVPGAGGPPVVKEVLVWAAQYAASLNARGLDRVGLATTGSLAGLDWPTAVARVRLLGEAGRIAADDSRATMVRELDPRALGKRAAALGPNVPPPVRRRRPGATVVQRWARPDRSPGSPLDPEEDR